jgi:hypothetical protein
MPGFQTPATEVLFHEKDSGLRESVTEPLQLFVAASVTSGMAKPKLLKALRIAVAVCSFGLIALYVSCRAAGRGEQQANPTPQLTASPGAMDPGPEVFPGSKSAEIEWPSQAPPQPAPVQPAPKQREIMPGSKSAPVSYPK